MLILIIALVFLLFYQDRQGATAALLNSMPFTKEQMFWVKWLTGAGAIVGALLLCSLLLTGFYFANRSWMFAAPYRVILSWTILYLAYGLAAFSFLVFVQSLMGQSLVAAVVGPIASMVPWFFFSGVQSLIRAQFRLPYTENSAVLNWFDRAADAVVWPNLLSPQFHTQPNGVYYVTYQNLPGRILIFLAIIVICVWLSRIAYRQNAIEKNGQLLMFDFLEPFLVYGFAVCFGMLSGLVFGLGFSEGGVLVMDVFLIGGFLSGLLLAKRVVGYYRR